MEGAVVWVDGVSVWQYTSSHTQRGRSAASDCRANWVVRGRMPAKLAVRLLDLY